MAFENNPNATASVTVDTPVVAVPGYTVNQPAVQVYSQDFTGNVTDGWQGGTSNGAYGHTAVPSFSNNQATTDPIQLSRTVSGLTVGRSYTFDAWLATSRSASTTVLASLGVVGIGDQVYTALPAQSGGVLTWVKYSYTFTATATTHTIRARSYSTGVTMNAYLVMDDVTLTRNAYTVTVPPVMTLTPELKLSEGDLTLDSSRYPYVQGNVQVPMTSDDLLERIDPGQRVVINADDGTTDILADLTLRKRSVSHDGKKISLDLASDEALLDTWADIVDDKTPRTHEANLRNLVNYVLGKAIPGAELESGTTNASIPAAWDATNLILDPRYIGTAGQYSQTNVTTVVDNTFPGPINGITHRGVHLSVPSTNDGYINVGATSGMAFSMQAGKTYVFSATGSVRTVIGGSGQSDVDAAYGTTLPRQRALVVHATGPGFSPAYKVWHSPQVPNVAETGTSAGTRVSVKFTVPKGSTDVFLRAYHGGTSGSITWSQFQLTEVGPGTTAEDAEYFFGNKPTDGKYAYKFRELADGSPSERKAIQERSPALFNWRAGQTAWDFLSPLVASVGLRLFCDEQRRWWLIDPIGYSVPGRFSARPDNAVEGTDTMDADDEDNGVTGVVAVFKWTDLDGISHEETDSAGVAGKVKILEFEREYPGPGLAAAHLVKVQGMGRVQDVTVKTDYTVRPGMEVQIDLPGTYAQLGTLTRVQWELTNGLMNVGSAGLRETPPGAIDLLTGTIDQLTGTINSL